MNQETSWERRGHQRKPNVMVRWIYATLDWMGDFRYLGQSMKLGTGHFLAVTVSTLITLSILIASTVHSVALLERAGLQGGLQYVMLLPFEALFLASSSALNKSMAQGKYFPLWPCAGFAVSLVFIWRSNVTGLAENIDGQVLAWLTPFLLLISKGLLAWQFKHRPTVTQPTVVQPKTGRTEAKPAAQEDENTTVEKGEPASEKQRQAAEIQFEKTEKEAVEKEDESPAEMIEENPIDKAEKNPEKKQVEPAGEIQEPATENPAEMSDQNPEENPVHIQDQIQGSVDKISKQKTPEKTTKKTTENPEKISKLKRRRSKALSDKKTDKKSKENIQKNIQTDIPTIVAIAQQLKAAGILSRATLENQANTTTHYAKKALEEMKQMEAEKPVDIQADIQAEKTTKFALIQ